MILSGSTEKEVNGETENPTFDRPIDLLRNSFKQKGLDRYLMDAFVIEKNQQ